MTDMAEPKAECKKCGATFLQRTAEVTGGYCMPCAQEEGTGHRLYTMNLPELEDFWCCECGGTEMDSMWEVFCRIDKSNPWTLESSRVKCAECGAILPHRLVFRGKDLSKEQAKAEWEETFRLRPVRDANEYTEQDNDVPDGTN